MSDDPPRKSPAEATLDDLRPVDTQPVLSPVSTITLDEEPAQAPPPTMLLDPVPETPRLDVQANATAPTARRRAALKPDAFESSSPSLDVPVDQRVVAPASTAKREWSPGTVALAVMAIAVVLILCWLVLS